MGEEKKETVVASSKGPALFLDRWWFLLLCSIALAFLSTLLGSAAVSPLSPRWRIDWTNIDAGFFVLGGQEVLNGKILYLDFYDHKGPFLFLWNAFELLFGGKNGLFLWDSLSLSSVYFAVFLLAQEFGYRRWHLFFLGSLLFVSYCSFTGGHSISEMLLPYFTYSFYFYLKGLHRNENRWCLYGSLFAGIHAALSFGSRPSEAAWSFALVLGYFVFYLRTKKDRSLLPNFLIAFFSFALIVLAFVIMGLVQHSLKSMIKDAFLVNFVYASSHHGVVLDVVLITAGLTIIPWLFYPFYKSKLGKEEALFYEIVLVFSGVFEIYFARLYAYWVSALSIYAFGVFLAVESLLCLPKKKLSPKLLRIFASAFGVLALGFSLVSPVYYRASDSALKSGDSVIYCSYKEEAAAYQHLDEIKAEGIKDGDVFLIDAAPVIYVYLDVYSPEKYYSNQTWYGHDNEEVIPETLAYLKKEQPRFVINQKHYDPTTDERLSDYLVNSGVYRLRAEDVYFMIYEKI
jgi:hypothetical protein